MSPMTSFCQFSAFKSSYLQSVLVGWWEQCEGFSMSDHQLILPDEVYQGLMAAAASEGVSPADWIASHLPPTVKQPHFNPGDISDLIGSVDSRRSGHRPAPTPFEQILIDKMAKQGVRIP